jgi:hypothetical protein
MRCINQVLQVFVRASAVGSREVFLTLAVALLALFASPDVAFAHIPTRSPYLAEVDEAAWARLSFVIFGLGQAAGFAYLSIILSCVRRGSRWSSLGLALLLQVVVAGLVFMAGVLAFVWATGFNRELHVVASPIEMAAVIRGELLSPLAFANVVTFLLFVGVSWLLLLSTRELRRTWLTPFVHTLVFHPTTFPVGILLGAMHAIYVARTASRPHAPEA